MNRYKISLPKEPLLAEEILIQRKLHRKKIWAKLLLIIYNQEPTIISEMEKEIRGFTRQQLHRLLNSFVSMGLIGYYIPGNSRSNSAMKRRVDMKWKKVKKRIPSEYLRLNKTPRFYFVNDFGEKFVPTACDSLKLRYVESKGFKEVEKKSKPKPVEGE